MTYSSESEEELALPVEIDICNLATPKLVNGSLFSYVVRRLSEDLLEKW